MNPYDPQPFAQSVLYEDNHLLVVHKPAGILAQDDGSGRPDLLNQAKDYLRLKYNKPGRVFVGLVHRLDRQVAGVVVLARTSKAAGRLSAQFRDHSTRKIYWAVVHGALRPPTGTSEIHLLWNDRLSVPADPARPGAQRAALAYRTLETGPASSLVEVDLLTGRRHQIRAQLAALGHPILGDRLYGSSLEPRGDAIGLLARRLTVRHPTRDELLTFDAPPAPDWPWLPLE